MDSRSCGNGRKWGSLSHITKEATDIVLNPFHRFQPIFFAKKKQNVIHMHQYMLKQWSDKGKFYFL